MAIGPSCWTFHATRTGRRRQKWHSGFTTRREAERALTEKLRQVETHSYVEQSKQTVGTFLNEWLDATRATVQESTQHSYRMLVDWYVTPRLGAVPTQDLTPAHLNVLYADLLARGGRGEKPLSARTVRYTHTVIRKALAQGLRWNVLARNVADLADPPRKSAASAMRVWTSAELRRFLEYVKDDRLYAAWLLSATTGMRRGEVIGLRWRDIDFDTARVAIRQTLITVDYAMTFSTPKTARGRRSVALDPTTVAALRTHRTRQLEERLAFGPGYEDHDLAFACEDGTPMHPGRFGHLFNTHVKAAQLPCIRFHDLRHTHATLALQAGIHPKVVSERLGHSTISMTLDTYSHAIPAMQEEAAAKIADLVWNASAER